MSFPPQSILVASDLGPASAGAAEHARYLARRFGARLEAVFVAEPAPVEPWLAGAALTRGAREQILARLREQAGEGATMSIVQGDPVDVILRLARERRPDLIVMGTHGRSGLGRLMSGSVAEAVVRLSPCPVLVAHAPPQPVRAVLAPVNLASYSHSGLFYAAKAAAALGKPLRVLLVCGEEESVDRWSRRLAAALDALPSSVAHAAHASIEVRQGDPTAEIINAGAEAGLVVLVAHRKSLMNDIVLGTTAERVLRHSAVPVIAVPGLRAAVAAGTEARHGVYLFGI